MLVEASVSPIHSAVLGLLVGHNPVEVALGPTVLAVLVEAAVGPIHSAALVKTALGPPALVVLVGAALGPIHSAALVETALGPIHGVVHARPRPPCQSSQRLDASSAMRSATRLAWHPTCRPRQRWSTRCSA